MAPRDPSRPAVHLFRGSVLVTLLPIVVAAVGALRRDWIPIGDNAFFAIRARDVFTAHPPLLGTYTSASVAARENFNNPGPLLFDLLAVPVRLFDHGPGLVVGMALLNSLAVIGIAVLAHRRGGPLLGTVAMAITAALCWAMGSAVLLDAPQPSSLLLPFLTYLMLVWAITSGDVVAVPWAAGVASLIMQSHLSYLLLVPVLAGFAVLCLVLELRRRRRDDPSSWPALRRRAAWCGTVAVLVLAVCWAAPVIEQITSDGAGNFTRLARNASNPGLDPLGAKTGSQVVARVVAVPPWWFRPSFREYFISGGTRLSYPPLGVAVASLGLVAAVLAGCALEARRRADRVAGYAIATAACALFAGIVSAARTPFGFFGITPHVYRWLWPLGAFVVLAVASTLARRLGHGPVRAVRLPAIVGVVCVAVLVFSALNLPRSDQGASADESGVPAIRDLARQMAKLEGKGPMLVDLRATFADIFSTAVMAELQRRDIGFVTNDAVLLHQLGPSRRFNGNNARARLVLLEGSAARVAPPGASRVAAHEGLTTREQRELSQLGDALGRYIRDGRLRLSRRGAAKLDAFPELVPLVTNRRSFPPGSDPEPLLRSGALRRMFDDDGLALGGGWAGHFGRYVALQKQRETQTAALFLAPIGPQTRALERGS